MKQKKIAVYTCITRGYDVLKPPRFTDSRLAYYCFTDDPANSVAPWTYAPLALPQLSPKDQNRYVKMHPHEFLPDFDLTVYIDGNIQIVGDIHALALSTVTRPEELFLYHHSVRNCIYAEAAACAHYSHDWIWTIAAQMRRYRSAGYPLEHGLYEANVIVRKNTAGTRDLLEAWWKEYRAGARRDQISLPYVSWKTGVAFGSLGESDPRLGHRFFLLNARSAKPRLSVILRKYINRVTASCVSYEKLFGLTRPLMVNKH